MPQRRKGTRIDDKVENHFDQERSHFKRNHSKTLQTDNMFAYDEQDRLYQKDKRLFWMLSAIFRRIKRMSQRNKRNWWPFIYKPVHFKRCKNEAENGAMACIDNKKGYHMIPQTWIIKSLRRFLISLKVTNLITKAMESWKSNLRQKDKPYQEKTPKRRLPGRHNLATTAKLHTKKMPRRLQIYKITEKDKLLYFSWWH